jgi:ABC-type Na+ efflux pump permease subunit
MGVVFPVTFIFALNAQATSLTHVQLLTAAGQVANEATTFLILIAAFLPSIVGSYSFVGEKIEKSLEPLLATPTTDGELLLGKSLASFVPCLAATFIGGAISASILDVWSYTKLGVLLLPDVYWLMVLFVMAPLVCIMSVEANVIVSSRMNDIRAAQQIGSLISLPLILFVILAAATALASVLMAVLVIAVLAVVDVTLFYLSKKTFKREEILTKWK